MGAESLAISVVPVNGKEELRSTIVPDATQEWRRQTVLLTPAANDFKVFFI